MATYFRVNVINKQSVNAFYDILVEEIEKHSHPLDRIFNVDKSDISVVQRKVQRVVGLEGKRQVGALSSA